MIKAVPIGQIYTSIMNVQKKCNLYTLLIPTLRFSFGGSIMACQFPRGSYPSVFYIPPLPPVRNLLFSSSSQVKKGYQTFIKLLHYNHLL